MTVNLILASASASRKALMNGAGLAYRSIPADIDERAIEERLVANHAKPTDVAVELACAKALFVSAREPDAYVIGSDQVLSLGDRLFHKPVDMAAAGEHIRALSGQTHHLNCGVAIVRNGEVLWSEISIAAMTMREISPTFLHHYLETSGAGILQSVGAYQLEGMGIRLFDRIDGDNFTILGLPMLKLLHGLRHLGLIDA